MKYKNIVLVLILFLVPLFFVVSGLTGLYKSEMTNVHIAEQLWYYCKYFIWTASLLTFFILGTDYKNADKEHEKETLFHLIITFQLATFIFMASILSGGNVIKSAFSMLFITPFYGLGVKYFYRNIKKKQV